MNNRMRLRDQEKEIKIEKDVFHEQSKFILWLSSTG